MKNSPAIGRRRQLLSLTNYHGAEYSRYNMHNILGPHGEELSTDVIMLGSTEARHVVVISTGVHGGTYGTTAAMGWLGAAMETTERNKNVRFVFVHDINPYATAHGLRTDQENIDVGRNFQHDFNKLPDSQAYRALADALVPRKLGAAATVRAWTKMLTFAATKGVKQFTQALTGGQSEIKDGQYYTGISPSWSHRRWKDIIEDHVIHAGLVSIRHIDISTGNGPYGKQQIMLNTEPGSALHQRVKKMDLGSDITITQSSFAKLSGDIIDFWPHFDLPKSFEVTPMTLTVGTSKAPSFVEGIDLLPAMMQRATLKQYYGDSHPQADKIISNLRNKFDPDDKDWQNAARTQRQKFFNRLVATLPSGPRG